MTRSELVAICASNLLAPVVAQKSLLGIDKFEIGWSIELAARIIGPEQPMPKSSRSTDATEQEG